MNFKILEYIVAIAETGNVTKAAERLFISQSGLNQQLIKLETELGTPLFHRSKKEMRPTHAGRIYIENARRHRTASARSMICPTIPAAPFPLDFPMSTELTYSLILQRISAMLFPT